MAHLMTRLHKCGKTMQTQNAQFQSNANLMHNANLMTHLKSGEKKTTQAQNAQQLHTFLGGSELYNSPLNYN